MNKENFKDELNKELEGLSLEKIKKIINELVDKLPSSYYEYLLSKIKYLNNEKYEIDDKTLKEYDEILTKFTKIEEGEICFQSYSYETGSYSYYDADLDYVYYPSLELKKVLVATYELIKKLIIYKEYSKVITLFEAIINTNYTCEEVGNPEYDDSNEVYDFYDIEFDLVKDDLEIDLDETCLYAIYSLIMTDKLNKFEKIWNYTNICYNVNIKDVENIGIEKINDFDKFYNEWLKYLDKKNNE